MRPGWFTALAFVVAVICTASLITPQGGWGGIVSIVLVICAFVFDSWYRGGGKRTPPKEGSKNPLPELPQVPTTDLERRFAALKN